MSAAVCRVCQRAHEPGTPHVWIGPRLPLPPLDTPAEALVAHTHPPTPEVKLRPDIDYDPEKMHAALSGVPASCPGCIVKEFELEKYKGVIASYQKADDAQKTRVEQIVTLEQANAALIAQVASLQARLRKPKMERAKKHRAGKVPATAVGTLSTDDGVPS